MLVSTQDLYLTQSYIGDYGNSAVDTHHVGFELLFSTGFHLLIPSDHE